MSVSESNADLYEFLYCSVLAPEQPIGVVPQILRQARALNARAGITGLLVFDGARFCQHFEGPQQRAKALMERIGRDARHSKVQRLYEGPLARRRCERFDMGYAQPDEPDTFVDLPKLLREAALEHFLGLRARFDVSA